ncbi:MAG: IMP cyclohydrolase [Oscillospiraceae bacterium]|jgi:IMP cyclohydrolase|nr:IMP cyclohydrolase [Oscillospiraceae bacterium]
MPGKINELLSNNVYPGRGIILGRSEDGSRAVILYFIMGRSENSRNRVFAKTEDGIRTTAFDPAKLTDPSLIIYSPVRVYNGTTIVTNGIQTDTIYEFLKNGWEYSNALCEWEFEPDPPIYTPRISGLVRRDGSYNLSIIKSAYGNPNCCCRYFFEYSLAVPGLGHYISTYKTDGNPPPSFEGEPLPITIEVTDGLESFASSVWNALNDDNKVSLFAREIEIATGATHDLIVNKNQAG